MLQAADADAAVRRPVAIFARRRSDAAEEHLRTQVPVGGLSRILATSASISGLWCRIWLMFLILHTEHNRILRKRASLTSMLYEKIKQLAIFTPVPAAVKVVHRALQHDVGLVRRAGEGVGIHGETLLQTGNDVAVFVKAGGLAAARSPASFSAVGRTCWRGRWRAR